MTDIIIGSGPAALAATMARLNKGHGVLVLDVGQTLDENKARLHKELAASEPETWPDSLTEAYRARHFAIPDGISRYGSQYALRRMSDLVEADHPFIQLQSSHAFGGLSNVWGSAVLPWPVEDLSGWPITAADLAPHYRAMSDILPIAGRPAPYDDILAAPDAAPSHALPETRQEAELVRRLLAAEDRHGEARFWSGPARRAVAPNCRSCGFCLYGCPYELIFSTAAPFRRLQSEGRIAYRRAEAVRVAEEEDGVTVQTADGETVTGARVFVAAGVLETARILFESNADLAARGAELKDSSHIFTTFLHRWPAGKPDKDRLHTLSIAFVEFLDPAVSPHLVHNQIYGWNDFYVFEMTRQYARGISQVSPLFRPLARRVLVAQTFLHSDHCARIHLSPKPGDPDRKLSARLVPSDDHHPIFARARKTLKRYLRRAGLIPVGVGGRTGAHGSSFHTGGTFPMSRAPGLGETDKLGRPEGSTRIHLVDSSVMPAIPATTITYSVMANAHRIASLA